MSSIGVRLPLNYSSADGYRMLKRYRDAVRQNLQMLLLTSPGERVMEPEFGVGIRQYLFLGYSEKVDSQITRAVKKQTALYMPSLTITDILFRGDPDHNSISISIQYSVPDLGITDLIEFTI